ncbi:hypothetical protein CRUP_036686 [Coryphaenoides rupestris]|nr:hypothetical protein CRUP_036686 [Coryphaenoides rupestris]
MLLLALLTLGRAFYWACMRLVLVQVDVSGEKMGRGSGKKLVNLSSPRSCSNPYISNMSQAMLESGLPMMD